MWDTFNIRKSIGIIIVKSDWADVIFWGKYGFIGNYWPLEYREVREIGFYW